MSKIDNGGPAFPNVPSKGTDAFTSWDCGMSLRDYFAAAALTGVIAFPIPGSTKIAHNAAREAYVYADAMLAERAKREGQP